VEVLVALVIVAFGMGALMAAISSAADTAAYLRDKTLAQWIALNHIAEVRLLNRTAAVGKTKGDVEYAGQKWRWRQEIAETDVPTMMRIEVGVQMATDKAPSDTSDVGTDAQGYAAGFFGRIMGAANGLTPAWSQSTPGSLPGNASGILQNTPTGVPPQNPSSGGVVQP
jgi:general secretion pathway protein I